MIYYLHLCKFIALMRLPLLFLMIFSTSWLSAQLYIAPSNHADSYTYVKDRLVFVQNEIHLAENNKKETAASIYLRRDAQLIQGSKTSNLNTGNGKLSVFQQGTTNAYDYNYWSLPILVQDRDDKINDYIFEPIDATYSRNAKLISATDGLSDPLSISSRWIYTFSGNNYSNWAFAGDQFDILPGEGFTMKGVNGKNLNEIEGELINIGNSQTYDFRGLPNDGEIELPIKKDQILLIGNPYPSSLDLDKFLIENTATTGIAYFWDSKENGNSHYLADYEGGYGTYSPGAGVYVPPAFIKYSDGGATGETGKNFYRKIIPIAQGFMITGLKEGSFSFKNSYRTYEKKAEKLSVFKSTVDEKDSDVEKSSMNLNIEIDSTYIQKLALVFLKNSSPDEDRTMDARKMNNNSQDISWSISNDAFVINVRPKVDEELIPLKIFLNKQTELKFSISDLSNFNPDRVFIYDAKDRLYFNIKTGYLKVDLAAGEYNDRFYLSFIEKLTATVSTEKDTPEFNTNKPPNILLNSVEIFQNNLQQQLEIKLLYDSELRTIRLYDLNGKLYFTQNFTSKEKNFNFSTSNLSNAIYIVKVNTSDNKELTKKIGIKN